MKIPIPSLLLLSLASSLIANPLSVGDPAPHLEALDHRGGTVSFAEAYAQPWVLVFFYPRADTPGCTAQACSLRDAYEDLTTHGVKVIGVSLDSIEEQAAFASKHELPFTLIADTDGEVVRAFGVPTMQRGARQFSSRQAFLIRDGKVAWRDLSASTHRQAQDVLEQLAAAGTPEPRD